MHRLAKKRSSRVLDSKLKEGSRYQSWLAEFESKLRRAGLTQSSDLVTAGSDLYKAIAKLKLLEANFSSEETGKEDNLAGGRAHSCSAQLQRTVASRKSQHI